MQDTQRKELHNEQSEPRQGQGHSPESDRRFQSEHDAGGGGGFSTRFPSGQHDLGATGCNHSERRNSPDPLDHSAGLGDNGIWIRGNVHESVHNQAPKEKEIGQHIKPMLIAYLATGSNFIRQNLYETLMKEGQTKESAEAILSGQEKSWWNIIISLYTLIAAVLFIVRKITDNGILSPYLSIFGLMFLLLGISIAINFYRHQPKEPEIKMP